MTDSDDDVPNIALPRPKLELHTRLFLFFFYALAVVYGLRQMRLREPSPIDFMMQIAMPLCLATWAMQDIRHRKYRVPLLAKPWFFLFGSIVVPGYVIWSRGWRGLGWVVLHLFVWVVLAAIVGVVGGMLVYGPDWMRMRG
jgi:hypothetical protein